MTPQRSAIGVFYHIDEYLPGLDLAVPVQQTITADLTGATVWDRLASLYEGVADAVAGEARRGNCPVVVSGDCTTSIGTMAGLQRAGMDAGIVWLDAHGDVQTLETTASGYLGGLPLRLLVGYRPELIADRLGLRPVPERQVLLVDARDLDPPEVTYLEQAAIQRCEVADLSAADLPEGPLYVHLDLDLIDPGALPGLRYPAPDGATTAEAARALSVLLDTDRVAAVGIACTWLPGQGAAARVASHLEAALPG